MITYLIITAKIEQGISLFWFILIASGRKKQWLLQFTLMGIYVQCYFEVSDIFVH